MAYKSKRNKKIELDIKNALTAKKRKRKKKKDKPVVEKVISFKEEAICVKDYVESLTGNNTCQRPDISCYDTCCCCPFEEFCLCKLNTKNNKRRYKKMLKAR